MLLEHELVPEEPGMEESYTIIPDDMRMNPKCPCVTRTCPNHGFCKYCIEHHNCLIKKVEEMGLHGHPQFCRR